MATGVLILLLVLPQVVPLVSLFGSKYEPRKAAISRSGSSYSRSFSVRTSCSRSPRLRLGFQQQHLNNMWGMLANGLSLASILLVAAFEPTVPAFLAAVFVPGVLCRALNLGSLLIREQPHLRPALHNFSRETLRYLVGPSLGFLTVQVAVLLYQQVVILEVGRLLGPEGVAPFALMLQLVSLFGGVVAMIMLPLWPALADARTSRDASWIRSAYKRVTVGSMGYAAIVAVAFAVASDLFLRLVFGFEAGASDYLPALFAFYFVLTIWEYTNINFLFGLSMV